MAKAAAFAEHTLKIPAGDALAIAGDVVTHVWEECKFGRVTVDDERTFWSLVSERLYKTRNSWRIREMSLDAPMPNSEGDANGHDGGWNGYQPPDQIEVTYLNQVKAGIKLLPPKHESVMRLLSNGHNALDISEELRIPVHTVFHIIAEGRRFLWDRELVGIAIDTHRVAKQ